MLLLQFILAACNSASAPSTPPKPDASDEADESHHKNKKSVAEKDSASTSTDDSITTDSSEESTADSSSHSSSDSSAPEDPFASILHEDKLKACQNQGNIYDRRTASESSEGSCHTAKYPAKFACTKDGIISAFGNSSSIKTYLSTQDADGYVIDQCGSYASGNPIVFFIKKDLAEGSASIKIRVAEPK